MAASKLGRKQTNFRVAKERERKFFFGEKLHPQTLTTRARELLIEALVKIAGVFNGKHTASYTEQVCTGENNSHLM